MIKKLKEALNYKTYASFALIFFIFAAFVDSFAVYKNFKFSSLESWFYIAASNLGLLLFTLLAVRKRETKLKLDFKGVFEKNYPLIVLMALVAVLAVLNYDTVAIYDAHLYYGSYIVGNDMFDLTLKTAIGAYVNWGHEFLGGAMLVSPFELLFPQEMYGSYIANTVLMLITMVVLYKFLEEEFLTKPNKWLSTFAVAAFVFMPYSFSLITYFCPDYFLELYLVWIMYAYKKNNHILVSFFGFLMCTTKDAGAFVYGFFVLSLYVFDFLRQFKVEKFKVFKHLSFGKFILWLIPAGIYLVNFILIPKLTMQTFSGAGTISFGFNPYDFEIQLNQSFVWGFKWLLCALGALAFIVFAVKKIASRVSGKDYAPVMKSGSTIFFYGSMATAVIFTLFLCSFTLSHCPRYIAPLNVFYTLLLVVSVSVLTNKEVIKALMSLVLSAVMLVQTYITIDPAIIKGCTSIDTGNHLIYNVGNSNRYGAGFFADLVGDYYVYNMEYSVYSDLVNQTLKFFAPTTPITFAIYDTYYYEMHFAGLQYKIFWDTVNQRQTYAQNENTVEVSDATLYAADDINTDIKNVILVVPARKSATNAINKFLDAGYTLVNDFTASNAYGSMTSYQFIMYE